MMKTKEKQVEKRIATEVISIKNDCFIEIKREEEEEETEGEEKEE